MPKNSTIATLLVSTAAAGLSGAVIAGAADSSKSSSSSNTSAATTPANGYPGGPGGHRGPGGPGRGGFGAEAAAVAKALGVTEAELKKAVEAARPAKDSGTSRPDKADRLEETAAALAKELGESTADVQAVIESLRPAAGTRPDRGDQPSGTTPPAGDRGGRGHGGPGRGGFARNEAALVTALAKKFSISEAKAQAAVDAVQKAHEAEHAAREEAFYAAVAKSLGKSADDVQKAFEAARPAKPTTK